MDKATNNVTIRRIIKNAIFMIKYAAQYDKPLITRIIVLYVLFKGGMAVNDTFILKTIINGITGKVPFSEIVMVLLISLVLLVCMEWVDQLLKEWSKAKLIKLGGRIQRDLIEKNSKVDLIYYDNPDYYDTYVIVANNADEMIEKTVMLASNILGGTMALLIAACLIMTINPILAIFPICGFIINLLTRFKIEKLSYKWDIDCKKALRKADYSKRVFYQPEFAKECKMTDVKIPLRKQFDEAIDEAVVAGKKYAPAMTWLSILNWIGVFTVFSFFTVPAYLGYLALVVKEIALGEVASANNAANYIRRNLDQINFCMVDFQQVGQYAEKFRKLLECNPEIEIEEGAIPSDKPGILTLSNVSFKYPNSKKTTLDDISIDIHPGEKIAIVGENGAGKTTFVKLLMRLYDVTSGSIIYDGKNIREYNTKEYRKRIRAVFQDYNIYSATIAENVAMRKVEDKDIPNIIEALKKADFEEKLNSLPKGVYTELTREFSNEGTNLSGGEGQKIAISRTFFRNTGRLISILDEPSSALDPISEYKLNKNLIESSGNDTVILISHRLSTTRMANRIYLFEQGRIIEQGSHKELMDLNGRYREMFDRQANSYI